MNKKKKNGLSKKIMCIAVIPSVILFIASTLFTILTMTGRLKEMVYNNIYGAGRGMELALTQLDATFTADEVCDIFDLLHEETGYHFTLYMGEKVYATSVKENGERVKEPLDSKLLETIMSGERIETDKVTINGERYNSVYYPAAQHGEVFGAMYVGIRHDDVLKIIRDTPKPSFYSSLVVMIITVISGILVTNSIRKSLAVTNKAVSELAGGDLNKIDGVDEVAKKNDELGEVTSNILMLQNELHEIVSEIKERAVELGESEEQIHDIVGVCNNASSEISNAIQDIANGSVTQASELENASQQVDSIEHAINDISENIEHSADLVKLMMDSSKKTSDVFDKFMDVNNETMKSIDKITLQITNSADSSNQIVQAVEMINDIASQTSLLSLNASIEAARAGEAGKGFAVVADEIKKLSEQSASSAQDIRDVVEKLTAENSVNIQMSNDLKGILDKQSEIMEQSVTELRQLLDYINKTKESLEAIEDNNAKVTQTKDVLVKTISDLTTIAEGNASASEETTATMQELNANVNMLNTSSDKLHEMAEGLNKRMEFFKL